MVKLADLITLPAARFHAWLASALTDDGYAIFPDLIQREVALEIRHDMDRLRSSGKFRQAAIGKGAANQRAPETRGDETHWFEPGTLTQSQSKLVALLEAVRLDLNASLYLGLWDWEGHYAIYPPGTFYRRHLDRFANDSRRTLSVVFFFNPNWQLADGGALRMETDGSALEITPLAGTAVFFMSDRIPHEVLETHRDRYSFAGWYRTRES